MNNDYKSPIIVAYAVYDARGNGEGGVCPTLTGDHENRVTDYTAIACYVANRFAEYEEDKPTLRASGGDIGGGRKELSVSIFDSHPMDSRIKPVNVFPSVTAKMAKLCCDGTLILIGKNT